MARKKQQEPDLEELLNPGCKEALTRVTQLAVSLASTLDDLPQYCPRSDCNKDRTCRAFEHGFCCDGPFSREAKLMVSAIHQLLLSVDRKDIEQIFFSEGSLGNFRPQRLPARAMEAFAESTNSLEATE